jgi:antitoxin HicB
MFKYPVNFTQNDTDQGYVLTCDDIPAVIAYGNTVSEALDAGKESLEAAIESYLEDKKLVPVPSKTKRGQHGIELPTSLAAKVLLLNEMIAQNVRPAELARMLNTTPQEVNRLTNVRHTTRIDGITAALQALGKQLYVRVV